MRTPILCAAALLLAVAPALRAQAPADTALLPACAEGGISRVAMTVPPGQTPRQVAEALQAGGGLPEGTQVKFLAPHERPQLLNLDEFSDLVEMHVHRFLRAGLQVDGEALSLVTVSADGRVTDVDVHSGHRDVDRGMRELWRRARFEPVVVGSCRVPAYLHLNLRFNSSFDDQWRETQIRMQP